MHLLNFLLILLLPLSHAIPQLPRNLPTIRPRQTTPLFSAIAITTPPLPTPTTIDYSTLPPGTYTITRSDRSVLIVVVTAVQKTTTMTTPPATETSSLPTCPDECDCSWIKDKDSEE